MSNIYIYIYIYMYLYIYIYIYIKRFMSIAQSLEPNIVFDSVYPRHMHIRQFGWLLTCMSRLLMQKSI